MQSLIEWKANHIEVISKLIRERLGIDNWVKLNTLINVPLEEGFSYLGLDEYHKTAIILAANEIVKERNDNEKKAWDEIKARQEQMTSYRSNFDSLPKPPSINM